MRKRKELIITMEENLFHARRTNQLITKPFAGLEANEDEGQELGEDMEEGEEPNVAPETDTAGDTVE